MRERIALRLLIASSLVAAAAVLAGLLWAASASATAVSVSVGSAQVQSGQQAAVSVQAQGVPSPGIGAFTVDVTYTSTIVDPVGCQAGAGFFCNTDYAPGKVRCGGFDPYGRTGDVTLCSITFQATGQAGACSNLTPAVQELVDVNGTAIAATTASGSFCISQPPQPTPTPPPPQPTPTQPPAPTSTPVPPKPPAPVPTQPPTPPQDGGGTGGGTSNNSTSGGSPSGSPAAGGNESDDSTPSAEAPVAVASGGTTGGDTPGGSGSSSHETGSGNDATGDAEPRSPAVDESSGGSGLSALAIALIAIGGAALIAAASLGWMFRDRLRNLPIWGRFRYSSRT